MRRTSVCNAVHPTRSMTKSDSDSEPDEGPSDELSDLDLDRALLLDRLGEEFGAALGSEPSLTPVEFAARHPEVTATELIPVLRGVEMLVRTRRKTHGPFDPGRVVGPYRIRCELGRGGMGVVYEAVEEGLGRVVALKALNAAGVDDRVRARVAREARAAARLDHPCIVPVFGTGEVDGDVRYAMRRVDGVGLDLSFADLHAGQ